MNIAIIGGGAAGCFAAIALKRLRPEWPVTLYESGTRLLAKVAVTGGGRCNVTNSFREVRSMEEVYPRGARQMKRWMREFSHEDAYQWFEREGVRLLTQQDECVFPVSQDAMEIVGTLERLLRREGVMVCLKHRVAAIRHADSGAFALTMADKSQPSATHDRVLVAIGGCPKAAMLSLIDGLGIDTVAPVPSLFSLNIACKPLTALTGTVVERAQASIPGTKLRASGPLLITHWGLSGPAILKLSSHAARHLAERQYRETIAIRWLGDLSDEATAQLIDSLAARNPQKLMANVYPSELNCRLWALLLERSGLRQDMRWAELGKKGRNRLLSTITADTYQAEGKSRFKDEFVTCGGVALTALNAKTLEAKSLPGLFFAGEVTDVDAVTGGFNLQAAWTMGHVAAQAMSRD